MKQWMLLLLLIPLVAATTEFETAETSIVLDDNIAFVKSSLVLNAQDEIGNLTLILAPNPKAIVVNVNDERRACLVQAEFARCGTFARGTHTIKIEYETTYPVAVSGENTVIRYTDRLPYAAKKQDVSITLPLGYIIPREKDKDESFYLSPKPTDVYSDGQRIILFWSQRGQELPVSAIARKVLSTEMNWMFVAFGALIVMIGVVLWSLRKPRVVKARSKKKQPVKIVPSLIDNEQKVVEFLKQSGEVWQKQIQAATGFSKAKVSRVVRNLETRGVITKTPYGNTNKIALKR